MNNKSNAKGITLIALVITIIVLLILAGAAVSIGLNSGDLFGKANTAVTEWNSKVAEEDNYLNNYLEYLNLEKRINTGINILEFSIAGTSVAEADIPVPNGFTHIDGTKDTGYVIRDSSGNEFVWIPVDKNQRIKIKVSSTKEIENIKLSNPLGIEYNVGNETEKMYTIDPTNTSIFEKVANGQYKLAVTTEDGEIATEYLYVHSLYAIDTFSDCYYTDEWAKARGYGSLQDMIDEAKSHGWADISTKDEFLSRLVQDGEYDDLLNYYGTEDYASKVNTNGGFYIGRYEAIYEDGNAASKPSTSANLSTILTNGKVWNNISQAEALIRAKSYNSSLNSSLLTGAAWYRTLGWLYETGNKTGSDICLDSSSWGNCSNDTFSGTTSITNTGAFDETKANNIFDLAGNLQEWTTQMFMYESTEYNVAVGNRYSVPGNSPPANNYDGHGVGDNAGVGIGFRVVLYL